MVDPFFCQIGGSTFPETVEIQLHVWEHCQQLEKEIAEFVA
jgi:hypothetical protein